MAAHVVGADGEVEGGALVAVGKEAREGEDAEAGAAEGVYVDF